MKIGFIGGWGHHYLSQVKGATTAYAGDGHDNDRARERCGRMGGQWFDDARHMLEAFRPDVVNVGAVYGYNGAWAATALERDIPVVCEKPVASTWEQYRRLEELCRGNPARRVLVSEFPFRCERAFVAAHQAVRDGRIGAVVLATGQKSYRFGEARPKWYANREDYGGTALWVASHAIDYVRFVTGLPFTRVSGQSANISRKNYGTMEEATVTMLTLANGAPAVVHADYNRPAKAASHGDDRLRIAGSTGLLEIRDGRCVLVTNDQEATDITETASPAPACEQMLAAIRGESTGVYGTQASLEMARVLLSARDAADQGRILDIPQQ